MTPTLAQQLDARLDGRPRTWLARQIGVSYRALEWCLTGRTKSGRTMDALTAYLRDGTLPPAKPSSFDLLRDSLAEMQRMDAGEPIGRITTPAQLGLSQDDREPAQDAPESRGMAPSCPDPAPDSHPDPEHDPTPWCLHCGPRSACTCGPIAAND